MKKRSLLPAGLPRRFDNAELMAKKLEEEFSWAGGCWGWDFSVEVMVVVVVVVVVVGAGAAVVELTVGAWTQSYI